VFDEQYESDRCSKNDRTLRKQAEQHQRHAHRHRDQEHDDPLRGAVRCDEAKPRRVSTRRTVEGG
jgi:hypothetical protein